MLEDVTCRSFAEGKIWAGLQILNSFVTAQTSPSACPVIQLPECLRITK